MGIEIICQIQGVIPFPNGPDDADKVHAEYLNNELVRCRMTRVGDALKPSIKENNLLHACFDLVPEGPNQIANAESAKFACKMAIGFVHRDRVAFTKKGEPIFEPRSFAFGSLHGKERPKVMGKAFLWCADAIQLTVEEMVVEAKSKMRRW